jgi:hypothetical protein
MEIIVRMTIIVFLAALVVMVSGCSVNKPFVALEEEPYIQNLENAHPSNYVAAIAPIDIGFDAAKINKEASGRFALIPVMDRLTELVRNSVRNAKVFEKLIDESPKTLDEAWKLGADIFISAKLSEYQVYYIGTNKLFVPNIINWFFFEVPSYFVRDEVYGLSGKIEFSFKSTHSGKELLSSTANFTVERSLDDFERGWQILGILRVPGSLSESNWFKVADSLKQYEEKEMQLSIIKIMNEDVRSAVKSDAFKQNMAKRCGLVVGLSRYKAEALTRLKFADDDAIAFRNALISATKEPTAERNIRILTNDSATKDALFKELGALVKRLQPEDEMFFYFAGYGARRLRTMKAETKIEEKNEGENEGKEPSEPPEKGEDSKEQTFAEPALLLFDSDPDNPETFVPLLDIINLLKESPAKVVIIVDAGFGTEKPLRSAGFDVKDALSFKELFISLVDEKQFVILSASDCFLGEGAAEFEHQKHGVATFYLLEGMAGKADIDKNGSVTLKEAFLFLYPRVVEESQMEACAQHPFILGKGIENIILK